MQLLRRHVRRRAIADARHHRHVEIGRTLAFAGESEIGDAHPAVGADEHILWLEVPMHESRIVRGGDAVARFYEHLDDFAEPARLFPEPLAQGHSIDPLHGDEDPFAV